MFEIAEASGVRTGTKIIIHLKSDSREFASEARVRGEREPGLRGMGARRHWGSSVVRALLVLVAWGCGLRVAQGGQACWGTVRFGSVFRPQCLHVVHSLASPVS